MVDPQTMRVVVSGRQARHMVEVLKVEVGKSLRVGIKNGCRGTGTVESIELSKGSPNLHKIGLSLQLQSDSAPQTAPLIDLLLALPRPKVFDKVIQYAAAMGVGRLIFACTQKVDKAYLSSPKMSEDAIQDALQLGLEQSVDTFSPDVLVYASWSRCLQQVQEKIFGVQGGERFLKIVAHPGEDLTVASAGVGTHTGPVMLALGPEGGFTDSEVSDLKMIGFRGVTLGNRILRVEAAILSIMREVQILQTDPTIRGALMAASGSSAPPQPASRSDLDPQRGLRLGAEASPLVTADSSVKLPVKGRRAAEGEASSSSSGCAEGEGGGSGTEKRLRREERGDAEEAGQGNGPDQTAHPRQDTPLGLASGTGSLR
uniref:16S rRNA (uracil(1498)-N(3))-methyltransferase n=1 Tax=Chromera velia CCMP2878 TaxID=1169474 RepID=A0A0G4HFW2_9ALVE|eukprot:Cvel_27031.t1-p1 / transcript=Cvel_27031.t1 / gene=Cvel_27031 / organism=Chromera_velia_CCMP2878 / gene_product=Ribosomal RNA small subunit methyltransferase E, putative / transcript_product=Ribosomal RNA small subunit methyltransferase E, putative / location=Cvel_scaffold3307:10170-16122(-) / protein_length=371 / sequence_SO=supercontig / SO=protein_coding / is_pseudo=false